MTPEQVAELIWGYISGNGLSMNQAKALTIKLLTDWKTEEEARLRYQLVSIKSNHTEHPKLVAAVKKALE